MSNMIGHVNKTTDLTFHFGIGSNNVEDCPANLISDAHNMKDKATNPNSAYNCLIQKTITSQDAAMTQGATIRNGSTCSKSVPFPPHCYRSISDAPPCFFKRTQ